MKSLLCTTLAIGLSTAAMAATPAVFDLDFKGGTLSQFVQSVQTAAPQSNIVLQSSGSGAVVPPMSLHGVTAQSCVFVLDELPKVNVETIQMGDGSKPIFVIDSYEVVAVGGSQRGRTGRTARIAVSNATEVFAVPRNYRSSTESARLVTVLKAVCELSGNPAPKMTVLTDVGLLAVYGTPSQISLCGASLDSLPLMMDRQQGESNGTEHEAAAGNTRDMLMERMQAASDAKADAATPEATAAANVEFKAAFEALRAHGRTRQATAQSP
jgi:hypothetical protein